MSVEFHSNGRGPQPISQEIKDLESINLSVHLENSSPHIFLKYLPEENSVNNEWKNHRGSYILYIYVVTSFCD